MKSDINMIDIGIKKDNLLSIKHAPPNNAIAPIIVKFGGWGMIRVSTPNNIKMVSMKLFLFNIRF